jgi:hypothetical protein
MEREKISEGSEVATNSRRRKQPDMTCSQWFSLEPQPNEKPTTLAKRLMRGCTANPRAILINDLPN